jgi:hypothetical protein
MLKSLIVPLTAVSLTFTSTVAGAAAVTSAQAVPVSACAAPVGAGAAAAAQAPRPGCVLPQIDAGLPVSTESAALGAPGMAGWILPILGLAGVAALVAALRAGNGNGSGSLSRG